VENWVPWKGDEKVRYLCGIGGEKWAPIRNGEGRSGHLCGRGGVR